MQLAVVDADIIHKGVVYGLVEEILQSIPIKASKHGVLVATKYVVHNKIRKQILKQDTKIILHRLEQVIGKLDQLEPSPEELNIAAQLEFKAQQLNISFDTGESQLCAIMLARKLPYLLTGDKRAIIAAETIFREHNDFVALKAKMICIEQAFLWLLENNSYGDIRDRVCIDAGTDKSLAICFSCTSQQTTYKNIQDGLNSYIHSLVKQAPNVVLTI